MLLLMLHPFCIYPLGAFSVFLLVNIYMLFSENNIAFGGGSEWEKRINAE